MALGRDTAGDAGGPGVRRPVEPPNVTVLSACAKYWVEEILATEAIKRNQIDDKIQLSCGPVGGDHRRVPPRNGGEQRRARARAVGGVYTQGWLESPFHRE